MNHILTNDGVSTRADKMNARYTLELRFVALIAIPKYTARNMVIYCCGVSMCSNFVYYTSVDEF